MKKIGGSVSIIRGGSAMDVRKEAALLYNRNPTILDQHDFIGFRCIAVFHKKQSNTLIEIGGCYG